MTPVLEKPYISVSINPENILFWHFTNGGHTRKSIMVAPVFLRIKRSIWSNEYTSTYRCPSKFNLVKRVYDDLQVPPKRQHGQMSIRRLTGPFKSQSDQMRIRRPTGILKKSNRLSFCFCFLFVSRMPLRSTL